LIPLKDTIPSRTYPIVTVSLIIVNVLVFLFELSLGEGLSEFFDIFGVVPATYFELKEAGAPFLLVYFPFCHFNVLARWVDAFDWKHALSLGLRGQS
jgi:membrane associated rhomboid family serine protease